MEESIDVAEVESSSAEQPSESKTNPTDEGSLESKESGAAQAAPAEKQIPFHEHPRFKELIEQKNQFAEQNKQFQSQLQDMQRRFQEMERVKSESSKQEDQLMKQLKEANPEFARRFEKIEGLTALEAKVQQFEQWQQQQAQERTRQEAMTTLNGLYETNKVPKELHSAYEAMLDKAARENPNLQVKDLPNVFKQVHDNFSKFIESTRRADRESYVKEKKQDASKPVTQPKGKPVPSSKGTEYSKNEEEAKGQMIQKILKLSRAQNDI
jgi:hypothetical protein